MRRNGHKYHAVRTEVDGHSFASKAEARRYAELKLLEKAGEIRELELQPKYAIEVMGSKICTYIADFRYRKLERSSVCGGFTWQLVTEDVKGVKTPEYRLKKKLVEAIYGATITEIGRATKVPKAKRAQATRRSNAQKSRASN